MHGSYPSHAREVERERESVRVYNKAALLLPTHPSQSIQDPERERAASHGHATHRLIVLLLVFLLGNSFHLIPADPASAGSIGLYLRVDLLLTTLAAATILLYMRMAASSEEAKAAKKGVAYKGSLGRKLRTLLLLAASLSAASTLLAVFTFEDGFRYRKRRASVLFGWPMMVLSLVMGVELGISTTLSLAS